MQKYVEQNIREELRQRGLDLDPRHIWAWIQLGLDESGSYWGDMTDSEWKHEIEIGIQATQEAPEESEQLAKSYGV